MNLKRVQCHGHAIAAEVERHLAVHHLDAVGQAGVLADKGGSRTAAHALDRVLHAFVCSSVVADRHDHIVGAVGQVNLERAVAGLGKVAGLGCQRVGAGALVEHRAAGLPTPAARGAVGGAR